MSHQASSRLLMTLKFIPHHGLALVNLLSADLCPWLAGWLADWLTGWLVVPQLLTPAM